MALNLKGKSFLKLLDFCPREIRYLLDLSRDLKRAKYTGNEIQTMQGKNVVLLFQKDSTRTRCAFEVAALDQGAHVTYLGPSGSQFGKKESVADTARVLGRMYDAIEFRGYEQAVVEELAKYSGVPVYNGLTNEFHPTQILADFLTVEEYKGNLKGLKFVFAGDTRNNVATSLMIGCAKMGMHFVGAAPKQLWPSQDLIDQSKEIAKETNAIISFTEDMKQACSDADVIYTDVWVSMGEPAEVWESRINLLKPYQVNMDAIKVAKPDVIFMHCLPSFHDLNTEIGRQIYEKFNIPEMEVTNEVFESKHSVVFEQAENRLHTIKAVMVATIGK
ncbi:ornithine carbamoyltransferase (ArcB) [synthetic Mycoplasma mycoides JCVI-syn1.0]|uniref:Ornithine carbamoyltransferase n=2 Tax=Mycoplasma mycoides TaxID=2102 RepID=A0AB38GEP3_MYCMC|nr:ornithine carbamoyltransferase [Mycoplasma mycoides]ADH22213.1 ornithine carbamoyltransferase (ArcB) [synthetic Mycoplasma mycoides JCVI-syn1.0]ACU78473.1 ornithine carbamoyltransferase (ArcB) [Mycoplasma mycoides subsp. capri str. GM12]ACU79303.1 ornithine carbamoyltransferase (ArcB) [Mycoplasma mycoides subsp. capri str. GM12]SRX62377.1 ornithine carbamoyltransferase [Mycoplasma mycoides subsp. capri]SRX63482.1 ornithine carbamoyltransferase [Mycoplasma mycoides subsp. capri]